jgi:hypothetical protein
MAEQRKKLRLGELLVQQGLITQDQLRIALTEQKTQNIPIGRLLVRLGFVTEAVIRDIMARTIGQESIDLSQVLVDAEALKLVPQDFARRHRLLPIAFDVEQNVMVVAITEVFNVVALDQLRATLGQDIQMKTVLAGQAQLDEFIDQFYGHVLSVDGILRVFETGEIDYQRFSVGDEHTQLSCGWSGRCLLTRSNAAVRHPFRTELPPAHPLPHDGVDRYAACTRTTGGDCGAAEGDQRHEHRRDPRPQTDGFRSTSMAGRWTPGFVATHHLGREHRAACADREIDHQPADGFAQMVMARST